MVYRGRVENGVVRLEGAPALPEGTEVTVVAVPPPGRNSPGGKRPTVNAALAGLAGKAKQLPPGCRAEP
jgi:hypothetical protein